MACFLVPTTEAIVTTIIKKSTDKKETNNPFINHIGWLNNMLWGGSALLAFEHIWHGEVTPWFPFLTNAADPESASVMLKEMATNGVGMALLVTLAWAFMVIISTQLAKKKQPEVSKEAAK
ncbi:MAG: hypothetical protein K5745_01215 [Saccharofermentans sp.]|nr:hypothetical protein [Saccharofermentans sp.]